MSAAGADAAAEVDDVAGCTMRYGDLPEGHEIKWVVSWYESGAWHNSRTGYTVVSLPRR